jgi:hypothetical protein
MDENHIDDVLAKADFAPDDMRAVMDSFIAHINSPESKAARTLLMRDRVAVRDAHGVHNWGPELRSALGVRCFSLPLHPQTRDWIVQRAYGEDGNPNHRDIRWVRDRFKRSNTAFIAKVGGVTPKDFTHPEPPMFSSVEDVFDAFASSMRTTDAVSEYMVADERPHIDLIEVMDLADPEIAEWRCFVCDGHVVGIARYRYDLPLASFKPYMESHSNQLIGRLTAFLQQKVIPFIPVDPIVVDLALIHTSSDGPGYQHEIRLLELNPWLESDPCGLDWDDITNWRPGSGGPLVAI